MAVEGLKKYRTKKEESKSSGSNVFLRIQDEQKVLIRPLQELDEDAKNFVVEAGTALFNVEWQNPDDFTKVISDTMESEGRCVGRELSRKPTGNKITTGNKAGQDETGWDIGWRPKEVMYLNVLVDDGQNEPVVKVARFNMSPKAVQFNALVECFENNGSITDRWFAYSRTGKGKTDTVYKLTPKDRDADLPPVTDYLDKFHELTALIPDVPYAKQREVLGISGSPDSNGAPVPATAGAAAGPSLQEW